MNHASHAGHIASRLLLVAVAVGLLPACAREVAIVINGNPPGISGVVSRVELGDGFTVVVRDAGVWVNDNFYGPIAKGSQLSVITSGPDAGVVKVNGVVVAPLSEPKNG